MYFEHAWKTLPSLRYFLFLCFLCLKPTVTPSLLLPRCSYMKYVGESKAIILFSSFKKRRHGVSHGEFSFSEGCIVMSEDIFLAEIALDNN